MNFPAKDVKRFRDLEKSELICLHPGFGMQLRNALIHGTSSDDKRLMAKELKLDGYLKTLPIFPDNLSSAAMEMLHNWVQGIETPE